MTKWDVYIAMVPYEDLPQAKPRPVIVLSDTGNMVACIKMTSKQPRPGEYVLQKWQAAGLRKPTTVRLSKRLLLKPAAFKKRLGSLHPIDILAIGNLISIHK